MTLLGNIISIPISLLDQTTKREKKKLHIVYYMLYPEKPFDVEHLLQFREGRGKPVCVL